jgi:hypothetical protein
MIPSWIIGLTDPVLKADFESFSGAGSITEAESGEALTGLAAEDEKSGATLSASQFADLQLMASNIGAMGASPYLQSITDALVYGDAANATWTGGGSKSVKLGNLAVGSTTTQLGELIDKWFYGADLPIDKVVMTGYASVTVTYSAVDAPLFGPDGPKMSDINQGYLGDCYLLASLAEVAKKNPSAITSMITDNNNGTYGVRFYVDGIARYVTVNNELADGGTEFNSATNIWASVVETAFAEVQDQGLITGNGKYNKGNSFSSIANGGVSANALEAITDATEIASSALAELDLDRPRLRPGADADQTPRGSEHRRGALDRGRRSLDRRRRRSKLGEERKICERQAHAHRRSRHVDLRLRRVDREAANSQSLGGGVWAKLGHDLPNKAQNAAC